MFFNEFSIFKYLLSFVNSQSNGRISEICETVEKSNALFGYS